MTTPQAWDEELEAGSSVTLTPEGWQRVEYAEPDETWTVRDDGSYESPDGQTRTWPLNPWRSSFLAAEVRVLPG